MRQKLKISVIPTLVLLTLFVFNQGDFIMTSSGETLNEPWVAPPEADKIVNPLEVDEYTLEDGKDVYTVNCMSCHGEKGDADTPIAAALDPKPKNYKDPSFLKQSDGAIYWKITTGKGLMVSFKDILSEEEIWSTIVYIKSLAKGSE